MRLTEVAPLLAVALMVILLVARRIIARLLEPARTGAASAGGPQAALPSATGGLALAATKRSGAAHLVGTDALHRPVGGELIRRTRDVVDHAPEEAVTASRAGLQEAEEQA